MGNWHIAIEGIGPHHNKGYDKDADKMAVEFVKALRAAGHTVEAATFTHGGRDDVGSVPFDPKAATRG